MARDNLLPTGMTLYIAEDEFYLLVAKALEKYFISVPYGWETTIRITAIQLTDGQAGIDAEIISEEVP